MEMRAFWYSSRNRGISFIEVLVGCALVALIFTGIIGGFQLAIKVVGHARAQSGALALANERIEYLRALPYDQVGTQGGIPSGTIAQNESVTLNGVTYNRRTLVQYVDAPEDGEGASDTNGITADYKRGKVELSWTIRGEARTLALVTNLVPRGIETVAGGGTLTINVFNAAAAPVASAAVRVVNASTSPAIDVTVYTNASGSAMFPGAPASGGYQISASKSGYSLDQTYSASVANPNPNPPHVSVIEGEVSTVNFAIDQLSSLVVRTVMPPTLTNDDDTFDTASGIASTTNAIVMGGDVLLATSSGLYVAQGTVATVAVTPTSLLSWSEVSWSATVPAQSALRASVYADNGSGTLALISDVDLPGNAAGFSASPIDLSALSAATYPRLALIFTLESFDGIDTPLIADRRFRYMVADTPIPGVAFTLFGAKNIGTDASGVPIKKYQELKQTNASGIMSTSTLEWDLYDIDVDGGVTGYDIADVCTSLPFALAPASAATTTLVLVPHTTRSALVHVTTAAGAPLADASVRVSKTGVDETVTTSSCGYAHVSGLPIGADFSIEISAPGYTTETLTNVTIDEDDRFEVMLMN